jgi:hypothetical protein
MATPTPGNPDFVLFVNYMGVELSLDNMTTFTDLFVNFTGFIPQFPCNTLPEKFILWKRYYDDFVTQQNQLANNNLFSNPKDPRTLKPAKIQDKLATLNNEEYAFQKFTFGDIKHEETPTPNHTLSTAYEMDNFESIEVLEETFTQPQAITTMKKENLASVPQPQSTTQTPPQSPPQSTTTATIHSPPPPQHRGKNIQQMKLIHSQESNPETPKPQRPVPKKRKRKQPEEEEREEEEYVNTHIPPGRPTKDHALIRDAKNEDSGNDDDTQYGLVEVHLLSGSGTIRKKLKLLTKSDGDVKCFAIRHYSALEYIAEKKKKAFAIIKHQRQTLKKLNYLEQNTLKDIKELKTLYNV